MQIQKQFDKPLYYNLIPDNKRQQTITVDYKRLINGFVLADGVSLQGEIQDNILWILTTTKPSKSQWELPKRISRNDYHGVPFGWHRNCKTYRWCEKENLNEDTILYHSNKHIKNRWSY